MPEPRVILHPQPASCVFSLAWALLLSLLVAVPAEAALSSNRYLFVVETSKSMQKRSEGVSKVVVDLLGSGMHGQLQPGDSVGLWTFNNQLHAGSFPLQDWAPDRRDVLVSRVQTFLRAQKYQKSASWSSVTPVLNQVIQNSGLITVVVISTGDDKISGTPFDDRIKKDYKLWRDQQEKAHMPLLTIFRAKHGTLTDCSITPVPFPVELPPLPKEFVVAAEKPPAPAPPPPPPKVVPPLIISGHKPSPTVPSPELASTNSLTSSSPTNSALVQSEFAAVQPTEKLKPSAPALPHSESSTNNAVVASSIQAASVATSTNAATLAKTEGDSNFPQPLPSAMPVAPSEPLKPGQKVLARELTTPSTGASASVATEASIAVPHGSARDGIYWAVAAAVVGLAGALLLVFARRQRAPEPLSLISRSLERERK